MLEERKSLDELHKEVYGGKRHGRNKDGADEFSYEHEPPDNDDDADCCCD